MSVISDALHWHDLEGEQSVSYAPILSGRLHHPSVQQLVCSDKMFMSLIFCACQHWNGSFVLCDKRLAISHLLDIGAQHNSITGSLCSWKLKSASNPILT